MVLLHSLVSIGTSIYLTVLPHSLVSIDPTLLGVLTLRIPVEACDRM